jgi:CheY-like chemotaxis protein
MKTILVVDDEFDLTSTLKAVLEHRGYRTETCSNGREAVESIATKHPDLIMLDVMMPLGNGYEVLDKIRARGETNGTPVVLMNSFPPPDERPVRWQAFLKKPLSIAPLLETVERLIGVPQ